MGKETRGGEDRAGSGRRGVQEARARARFGILYDNGIVSKCDIEV
jgi:hypothetical protein